MAINFPTSLDSLTNPTSSDGLNSPDHATQHANANDAIEALEAKVGINSSAVTTSHDYKLSAVTGSDKALKSGTSTQSVTNLTLVTPTLTLGSDATGDIYYRNSGGALTRLPIGTSGQILQVSSGGIVEWVANPSAADASTTVKGVVEIATTAEITSGTSTGGTGAILVVPASAVGSAGASKLVQFNSSGQYPAADGSLITNIANPITYKSGVTTKNISDSDTTQTIAHGLGKTPKFVRIRVVKGGTSGVTTVSVGSYNGTDQSCIYSGANNATSRDGNSSSAGVVLISSLTTNGYNTGTLSFDGTNISIAWVKSNSPSSETFQLAWEAEA